jgi:hypothetical protein
MKPKTTLATGGRLTGLPYAKNYQGSMERQEATAKVADSTYGPMVD